MLPYFKVVTDRQFALVGKKAGSTVLNLWFADPNDPNDAKKDRTLSYLVLVLPDYERAAIDLQQQRDCWRRKSRAMSRRSRRLKAN